MYEGLLEMVPEGINAAQGGDKGRFAGMAVGAGIGALLAPVTGGASIGLGASLGGAAGGSISMGQKAKEAKARQENMHAFRSIYKDTYDQRMDDMAQEKSASFINDRLALEVGRI